MVDNDAQTELRDIKLEIKVFKNIHNTIVDLTNKYIKAEQQTEPVLVMY